MRAAIDRFRGKQVLLADFEAEHVGRALIVVKGLDAGVFERVELASKAKGHFDARVDVRDVRALVTRADIRAGMALTRLQVADDRRRVTSGSADTCQPKWVPSRITLAEMAHTASRLLEHPICDRDRLGFEPVSQETQPVSGHSFTQISDIEKSVRRDWPRDFRLSAQDNRDSSPETRVLATNLRKCRFFAE
jgi:hypothetical protein